MKVIRETSRRYMALLIVFAMLAGMFPVGVFAETDFESDAETNIIQEYTEPEGEGTDTEPETDTLEKKLTDAEKVVASKDAIATVIDNLAVSNETTDIDILTAAQSEILYDVVVEWDGDHGFSKIDATSSNEGSIAGVLNLSANSESDYIFVDKIIEQLTISDDEKLDESEESPAGTLEPTKDIESDTIYKIDNLGSLALQNVVMIAAYSPTVYLTLDGQAASPGDLNGFLSRQSDTIISGMSVLYIDEYNYVMTENTKGTFTISDHITGYRRFGLRGGFSTLSFYYLFSTNHFTLSESNPTPRVDLFSVTYNPGNSGTGSEVKELAAKSINYTLRKGMYTRSGYDQTGWATSDGGNKVYDLEGVTNISAVTDLYPTWTAVQYPVSINVKKDGVVWGTGSPNITFGTTVGNAVPNGTSVVDGTYNIYANGTDTGKDVTVNGSSASVDLNYYTVTFKNDSNTSVLDTQIVLFGQTAVYGGTTPTKPSTAQYSYTFSKWVNTVGGTTATLDNITAAKTVYASFTQTPKSYTITYNSNGGSPVTSTNKGFGTNVIAPHAPTKTGYTFTGWTPEVPSTMPASDMTLVAQWSINSYTVSYDFNGGTASGNPASYTIESTSITLNNPTRAGYSFVGWTGSNGDISQTSVTIGIGSTGDKSYTANWKANAPTSAPEASIVTSVTDTSLTITTQDGYEYSVDGINWHNGTNGSYTFTGLTEGTPYNLVYRKAAVITGDTSAESDASPALSITTKKAAPAAPSINIALAEESIIRLTVVNGAEYSKDNGEIWQDSNEFSGLVAAKQYTFAIRIKETDITVAGIETSKTQYTAAATPAVDEGYNLNYSTEIISIEDGYEISSDGNFSAGKFVFDGSTITPGTTYYIRIAASGDVPKSFYAQFSLPARPAEPSAIGVSKTSGTITITTIAGQEYKIGSEAWQASGNLTGLSPKTDYTVSTRVKATDNTFASTVYSMSVMTKSVGSANVPTLDNVTYDPGQTLANITLPDNWAWSSPVTVPTVAISSYNTVYTPTDTDTVDYASVTGYAVDGNGTVTISEMVSLTVDPATPTAADFTYTSPVDLDYSDTDKSATVETKDGILGMGNIKVKYYLDSKEITPINAGIYTVKIDITQGDNYTGATGITDSVWTITIKKIAQAPLTITGKPDSITYGDTFTLDTTGGSGVGAVAWAMLEGGSSRLDLNTVTISGVNETTITATKAADGNYTADVTDTYTFTPDKFQLTIDSPTTEGGWRKVYDGSKEFNKDLISVGSIINKVGDDYVRVYVASATYDTADVDTGKELTIVYAIEGDDSENYFIPVSTLIGTASITPATPTVALVDKIIRYNRSVIEIEPATVTGIAAENDITANYDGIVTYIYYTKDTCTDDDKTTVDRSGAETIGSAPKSPGTYYVKALVPAIGNYSATTSTVAILRIYNPSNGGSSTPQQKESENTIVTVNGEPASAGTETKTTEDGKFTTLVQVNNEVIESKIEEAIKNNDTGLGNSIQISTADKDSEVVAFELTGDIVRRMEESAFNVSFKNNDIEYIIPAEEFTINKVAETLNIKETDLKKITVEVRITKLNEQTVEVYNEVAKANGAELIFLPVSFEVVAKTTKVDGSTEEVKIDKFSNYVERVMEIQEGIDPSKVTTGIVFNPDGSYNHVPTEVFQKDGKIYAKINSLTNSTYSVIWNPVTMKSVENHWVKDIVNDMASRLIIKNPEDFMPNQNITRGEFAEYITKALGIYRSGIVDTQKFSDVEATHELAYSIEIASEYGIISGYPDGSFKPGAQISREEAMAMYSRAMAIVGLAEEDSDRINNYTDKDLVASWAYNDVKKTISAGVFNGKTKETINPKDTFTCAEAATAIRNLLVATDLINE